MDVNLWMIGPSCELSSARPKPGAVFFMSREGLYFPERHGCRRGNACYSRLPQKKMPVAAPASFQALKMNDKLLQRKSRTGIRYCKICPSAILGGRISLGGMDAGSEMLVPRDKFHLRLKYRFGHLRLLSSRDINTSLCKRVGSPKRCA